MKTYFDNNPQHFITLRWWNSISNSEAGAWLEAIPKIPKLSMRSSEFRTALLYRYRVPIPSIRDGSRCDCKVSCFENGHRITQHPKLDLFGYHLSTGCGKDSHRINTHNICESHQQQNYEANGPPGFPAGSQLCGGGNWRRKCINR